VVRRVLAAFGALLTAAICIAIPTLLFGETRAVAGVVEGPEYAVVPVGATTTSAAEGQVGVRLEAKGEFKVHMDGAPLKIKLDPPAGVTLKKKQLGRKDAADAKAKSPSFLTAARADKAGEYEIPADVDFVLCTAKLCKPVKAQVTLKLTVNPSR